MERDMLEMRVSWGLSPPLVAWGGGREHGLRVRLDDPVRRPGRSRLTFVPLWTMVVTEGDLGAVGWVCGECPGSALRTGTAVGWSVRTLVSGEEPRGSVYLAPGLACKP